MPAGNDLRRYPTRPARPGSRPLEGRREPPPPGPTLEDCIRSLNSDFNLDIRPRKDIIYQRLEALVPANRLDSAIKLFESKARATFPNRLFPRAESKSEQIRLRNTLLSTITDTTTTTNDTALKSFPGGAVSAGPSRHLDPRKVKSFDSNRPSNTLNNLDASTAFYQNRDGTFVGGQPSAVPLSPKYRSRSGKRSSDEGLADTSPEKRQRTEILSRVSPPVDEPTPTPTQTNVRIPSSSAYSVSDDPEYMQALWTSFENLESYGTHVDEDDETESFVTRLPHLDDEMPRNKAEAQALAAKVERRLKTNIWPSLPECLEKLPFHVSWEVARVALHCGVTLAPDTIIEIDKDWGNMSYPQFWASLKKHVSFRNKPFPEPSSRDAWEAALRGVSSRSLGRNVQYSATAEFAKSSTSPFFAVTLSPIRLELTHRLGRQFGPHNFLEVIFPAFDDDEAVVKKIVDWMISDQHNILGRRWSFFFVKDASKKSNFRRDDLGRLTGKTVPLRRYYMVREKDGDKKLGRHEVVNWLLQVESNAKSHHQPYLKLFSRITLGVSRTCPTVVLRPDQIDHKAEDILSDQGIVMNDGCARMSCGLAREIIKILDLDFAPSAFQGRFGSAKGMWIVDTTKDEGDRNGDEDDIWIETYPSQRKWECDFGDENQRTFEVRDYPARTIQRAAVNTQLLPILEHGAAYRHKMRDTLAKLVQYSIQAELDKQEVAMQTPIDCLLWINQFRRSTAESRLEESVSETDSDSFGPFIGSFPDNSNDQIAFLAQHGFHPQKQKFIQDLAVQAFKDHCTRMGDNLKFHIGCSAYLFMLADMWGYLKEGEVHVCFSEAFRDDASGFSDTMLDGCDVLVARSPAHLPSDVQRVKSVFCRELRKLKNVIVFSTKGPVPLADKLSGGDYDGDLAWVCWDREIVRNFNNTPVPPDEVSLDKETGTYERLLRNHPKSGNRKAIDDMVRYGLEFNCKGVLLGSITVYKEYYCYRAETIANKEAIFLSHLLSHFVDQPKQGTIFTKEKWVELRKELGLPNRSELCEPAYTKQIGYKGKLSRHICDYLKFVVAKRAIDEGQRKVKQMLESSEASYKDADLVLWHDKLERDFPEIYSHLKYELYALKHDWVGKAATGPKWKEVVRHMHWQYGQIQPPKTSDQHERLAAILQDCWLPGHETLSSWALFKASVLFKMIWCRHNKFLWHMCGRELGVMKARASGHTVSITGNCHSILKVDKRAVARQRGKFVGMGGEESDVEEEDGV